MAPASSSKTGEGKGSTVAIAGLRHPSRRPILSSAAATVAPVFPAENNASASPSRTIPAATATLASGWALSAAEGSSSIPTALPGGPQRDVGREIGAHLSFDGVGLSDEQQLVARQPFWQRRGRRR